MIKKLMPHICIILALVTITLFILTQFNPGINDLGFYAACVYLFGVSAIIVSGIMIFQNRRD